MGEDCLVKTTLNNIKNGIVIAHGEELTPAIIYNLKEQGNKIVSFDINDSSTFTYTYCNDPSISQIDLIFKISGLQNSRFGQEFILEDDLSYSSETRQFMNEWQWDVYCKMREENRIHSLPYILWKDFPGHKWSYYQKKKKVLIRGGNHFYRYLLFLNLLKHNLCDESSGFPIGDYYLPNMSTQYRFCETCIEEFQKNGRLSYAYFKRNKHTCNNPYINWQEKPLPPGFFHTDVGQWNNRCAPLFYFLADKIVEKHGEIDRRILEESLNTPYYHGDEFTRIASTYSIFGDFKWIFSIYAPPRFWEAASLSAVNLLPKRTNEQEYFPEIKEGEHYITFKEDFSDIKEVVESITEVDYNRITDNCLDHYHMWIKPGRLPVSVNLLKHMTEKILNLQ